MSLGKLLTAKLAETKWASKKVQKFNQGWVYGTCDLGGLADATGLLQLTGPINLLGTKVGGDGGPLGFGAGTRLTEAETNMDVPSQMNSKRAIMVRGYGVSIEVFPQYDPQVAAVPSLVGWNPRVISQIAQRFILEYTRGTRNSYNAGPLRLNTAGEFGATATAIADTVNNERAGSIKSGAGSMVYFENPDAWLTVGPLDSIDFNIVQKGPGIFLTANGQAAGPNNPVITSARLQVVLDVFDIEQVV